MSSSTTIQMTVDFIRSYPSLTSVLGNPVAGYGGNAIPIRLANKVLQEVLQEPFAFKWNRVKPPVFYLNQLQQDYSTSITNLGWLENCTRRDVNYGTEPKPEYGVEAVKDLLPTFSRGTANEVCWIPNSEAICGQWAANTTFTSPLVNAPQAMPNQPYTQIRDSNGNIQVVTTYGTTGATPPTWPAAGANPGTTTTDGSVVWTLIDPNGITFRVSPRPPQGDRIWEIQPYYQLKPPVITKLTQFWGIPDEDTNVFEQGFLAYAWQCAEDDAKFEKEYALFQILIQKAVKAADRERDEFGMFPGRPITGRPVGFDRYTYPYPPGLFGQ